MGQTTFNAGVASLAGLLVGALTLSGCGQAPAGGINRSNELTDTRGTVERPNDAKPKQMTPRNAESATPEQLAPLASKQPEHPDERTIDGTVTGVKSHRVELELQDGQEVFVRVNPQTPVVREGLRASVQELQEGTKVRASYTPIGGQANARQIEVLKPAP